MLIEIVKAFLLGICVAAPIGPVLLLVLQKTFSRGRMWGLVTGIGSAVVDTAFAAVSLFALSLVKEYVIGHEGKILLIGGVVVVAIGLLMAFRRPDKVRERDFKGKTAVSYALQAAGCALSNPGALLLSFTLTAFFGLGAATVKAPVWLILLFVFLGEMAWWNFLTYALVHFRRFSEKTIRRLSHIAGCCVFLFGISLIVKGLLLVI